MSQLVEKIDALNRKLEAADARLMKVSSEQASVLADLADAKAKLADALAAGQAMPPAVLESLNRAFATAEGIEAKTASLDDAVVDVALPG